MTISYARIRRDVLSLLGESPDLAPALEPGEEHSVLTLDAMIKPLLAPCSREATRRLDPLFLDETLEVYPRIEWCGERWGRMKVPEDFMTLVSFRMPDWPDSLSALEPEDTLRAQLRGRAPGWLAGTSRPMALLRRHADGLWLYFVGSDSEAEVPDELCYVPVPSVGDDWSVTISGVAYPDMVSLLVETLREKAA